MDDIGDIADFYDDGVEAEDSRLEQHQLEYDLTWRYLTKYLPPSGSILEIGAATGAYTLELCRRGHAVTAVELSADLLARCEQRIAAAGLSKQARFVVADARDLDSVGDTSFDAVLLMGPLYHLVLEEDRREALRQAVNRVRSGRVVFSAFLSRLGIFGDLLKDKPDWIESPEAVAAFLETGRRPADAPRGGFRAYFAHASEIGPLHEKLGIETIALAGVEPAISADDDSYNQLTGVQRDRWLELLFAVSAQESTLGASRHLLYVGRKGHE